MNVIFLDRIGTVVIQNGVLRVDCIATGPNSEERPAGTLLIPANQVATVLQSLAGATQELDRRLREQQAAAAIAAAGSADPDSPPPPATKPASSASQKKASADR
jgi:hypothetical protein